jgi:hypothetical protein
MANKSKKLAYDHINKIAKNNTGKKRKISSNLKSFEYHENRIKQRCLERGFNFLGFIEYNGSHSRLQIKCNVDNCIFTPLYDNFLNKNSGCPACNKLIMNKRCKEFNKNRTPEQRLKMSISAKNKPPATLQTRLKMSEKRKGKKHSDEWRRKLRISTINYIEKHHGQLKARYNPSGCRYFEKLMKETGTFIQHAENGGEFHIKHLGYIVDGYDKENNIVYEYDEKRHFNYDGFLKERDVKRQKEIEDFLKCKFIRIKA